MNEPFTRADTEHDFYLKDGVGRTRSENALHIPVDKDHPNWMTLCELGSTLTIKKLIKIKTK